MFKLNITAEEAKTFDIRKTPYNIAAQAIEHTWDLLSKFGYQELEQFDILDPCCGTGTFIDAMLDLNGTWSMIEGYEISSNVFKWLERKYSLDYNVNIENTDFLNLENDEFGYHIIVGEPPVHLINEFIVKSLTCLSNGHSIIAFVVPKSFNPDGYNVIDSYNNDFDEDDKDTKTIFITKESN